MYRYLNLHVDVKSNSQCWTLACACLIHVYRVDVSGCQKLSFVFKRCSLPTPHFEIIIHHKQNVPFSYGYGCLCWWNWKQETGYFCVIQSTHNNYLAYSLVHVASQNYSTVYIFFCEAHRQTNATHILYCIIHCTVDCNNYNIYSTCLYLFCVWIALNIIFMYSIIGWTPVYTMYRSCTVHILYNLYFPY